LPHRCIADEQYLAILVAVGDVGCCVVFHEATGYLPVIEWLAFGLTIGRVEPLALMEDFAAMVQVGFVYICVSYVECIKDKSPYHRPIDDISLRMLQLLKAAAQFY
jgi:hypothetical protein